MFNEETTKVVLGNGSDGFSITPLAAAYLDVMDEFMVNYHIFHGRQFSTDEFDAYSGSDKLTKFTVPHWEDRCGKLATSILNLETFEQLDKLNNGIKLRIAEIPADLVDWVIEKDCYGHEYITRRAEKFMPPQSDYDFLINRKIDKMFANLVPCQTIYTVDVNDIHAVIGNNHAICAYKAENGKGYAVTFLEYVCFYDEKTQVCSNRWANVGHNVHINQSSMINLSKLFFEMNRFVEDRGGYHQW